MVVENMCRDKISIIVPIYNVEQYLERCIGSLVKQTYKNIEIILVDDGSPDNCCRMCDEWINRDNRIVVIHKTNGGLSDARNFGISVASGQYILFVDSDDYLELDACERLYNTIKITSADFVVGVIKEIRNNSISYQKHSSIKSEIQYNNQDFIIESIKFNEWYAPAVLNLYNRDFLDANFLLFKKGIYYEDMEILPRLYLAAKTISYLDYAFYNYEIRNNSITTGCSSPKKRTDCISIYSSWKKIFDTVENDELKKLLYGFLIKCYLYSCRVHNIKNWCIKDVDYTFAYKYANNSKERLKVVLFNYFPYLFNKIRG